MSPAAQWMLIVAGIMFAAASVMSIIRIVRGPSIVDRVVGSDTLATVVMCTLVTDMTIRGHTTTLPLVLGLAISASIGTMAVARFVSRSRPVNTLGEQADPAQSTASGMDSSTEPVYADEGMRDQGDFSDADTTADDHVSGVEVDGGEPHLAHTIATGDPKEGADER